jgi:alginate O-acetyltransferase complex protein AlgI
MEFTSWKFILFILISFVLFHGVRKNSWRRGIFFLMNLTFCASFFESWQTACPLIIFLSASYLALVGLKRWPSKALLIGVILAAVFFFAYLKQYNFLTALPKWPQVYSVIGLSYILFRVLHLFIDTAEGTLAETPSLFNYLNYSLNMFCFVSGPIEKYLELHKQEAMFDQILLEQRAVAKAFVRIINGYFKVAVVSAYCKGLLDYFAAQPLSSFFISYATLAYTFFLFFNFSGYMDIVIGFGSFFGFEISENFNRPFLAGNFIEFWARWHMTLSNWFRAYLFNPIVKFLVQRYENRTLIPYYGVIGFFITFFAMGVWHGSTIGLIYYGFLLGLAVSGNKLFEVKMRQQLGSQGFKELRTNTWYRLLAQSLTNAYFAYTLVWVWKETGALKVFLEAFSLRRHLQSFTICFLIFLTWNVVVLLLNRFRNLSPRLTQRFIQNIYLQNLGLGFRGFLIVIMVCRREGLPEFIYKVF